MPFATAQDGTRLFYDTIGQGPPLVLISGQAFDHHMWDGVRDDFATRHQVIVFDHRGIGHSDKPERVQAYSTRIFARDVVAILDALGIAHAHVYGFSMGGRIAQWLGIDHAQRVRSLVLGATTPGNAHGVRRPPEADAILGCGKPSALQDLLVSHGWRARHPEWQVMMAERARNPMPLFAQRLHFMASEMHETWDDLPGITAPTLVIHGTADQINVSANAPLLAQRIPSAQLHLIDGARHGFFWEHRQQASEAVSRFLAHVPAG